MFEKDSCIFCKIAKKEVESALVYEDDELIAFKDVSPKAPVHLLIVPKKHLANHLELSEEDCKWVGKAHLLANRLAKEFKADRDGFRLIVNCGRKAGQTVDHLHMHLMSGRTFQWPPG